VETIKEKTWLKDDISPYHLYLKFLYEYFREGTGKYDFISLAKLTDSATKLPWDMKNFIKSAWEEGGFRFGHAAQQHRGRYLQSFQAFSIAKEERLSRHLTCSSIILAWMYVHCVIILLTLYAYHPMHIKESHSNLKFDKSSG
jgi:hypothetical protein